MAEYQVLARKYRPQTFKEVVGQEAVVTTLKNAMKAKKTAHAYLFSGSRGTGKTTLARLFAKALNCPFLTDEYEPCNSCASCIEIAGGHSLDVLEIDGASHRGIEEIRKINETIAYAPSAGKYKIYLIDEVHMLTKEAFNALLKTLEEPPERVKFFFATTEHHKIPATIVSRCQRFHLHRISLEKIQEKLFAISQDLKIKVDRQALFTIAQMAEGGLRDAESLFDQVLAFEDQEITPSMVCEVLGLLPRHLFFELDEAGKKEDYSIVFKLTEQLFSSGMNIGYFVEELTAHFRTLLLLKMGTAVDLVPGLESRYQASHSFYTEAQCIDILEMLTEATQSLRFAPSQRVALEMLLIRILKSHQKVPLETIFNRLGQLEEKLRSPSSQKTAIEEDPSPKPHEVPVVKNSAKKETTKKADRIEKPKMELPEKREPDIKSLSPEENLRQQARTDTLMRFAAKELDGALKIN